MNVPRCLTQSADVAVTPPHTGAVILGLSTEVLH